MSDESFFSPNHTPPPKPPRRPGDPPFAFPCGPDRFRCELRNDVEYGIIEAQFVRVG